MLQKYNNNSNEKLIVTILDSQLARDSANVPRKKGTRFKETEMITDNFVFCKPNVILQTKIVFH